MSPRTQLLTAIGVSVAVVLVAVVTVRQELLGAMREEALTQQEATDKLTRKIAALDTRIGALETTPAPDVSGIDSLRSELESVKESIATHESKLSALHEKTTVAVNVNPSPAEKPAPAAPAPDSSALVTAVGSGNSYAAELAAWDKTHPGKATALPAIRRNASTGATPQSTLQAQFRDILRSIDTPQPQADEPKLIQRINTHLAGLVSIKKATDSAADYTALRSVDNASLDIMAAQVDALPSAAQSPFLIWREAVRNRTALDAELTALTAGNV